MAGSTPMPMCPMAETCKGMMEKPFSGLVMTVPGILFVVLGVLIIIEPKILAWIAAVACVLIGIMMLVMGSVIRRIGGTHIGA